MSHLAASTAHHPPHTFPSIIEANRLDLAFTPFQESCTTFLASLDAFVLRGKEEILLRKDKREQERVREEAERRRLEEEIIGAGSKESRLLEVLEKEKLELDELQSAISELKTNLSSLESQEKVLSGDVIEWTAKANSLKAEKAERQKATAALQKSITEELSELERELCWKVEGVKSDTLKFTFTHLSPSTPEKPYSLLIDVAQAAYAVPSMDPPLPLLPALLARLNSDRDFYSFIRRVRAAFKEIAMGE